MTTTSTDNTRRGTVIAVARALSLLQCFTLQDGYLSLAELSQRSTLHKTTVLRLARTLAEHQYLVRRHDGTWRLGPASGRRPASRSSLFSYRSIVTSGNW